jgi:hypothetical protein
MKISQAFPGKYLRAVAVQHWFAVSIPADFFRNNPSHG